MTDNLDGARNPVAVVVTRMRELAATEPEPPTTTAPAAGVGEPVGPHPYAGGKRGGRCTTCGRAEHVTVGRRRLHPRTAGGAVRRCGHGRVAVNCPTCTGRAPEPNSQPPTGRVGEGLTALGQAPVRMGLVTGAAGW